jgi:uncharacterized protein YgiM (DUF1202 family)
VTKTYGTVTYSYLRIRAGAGTGYASLGQLKQGDRVEILETKQVGGVLWGRFEKGWICITDYVKLETVTENQGGTTEPEDPKEPEKPQEPQKPDVPTPPVTVTKTYGIVTYAYLRIRAGAGVGYASVGQLKQGDRVEILETKQVGNVLWGRFDKGWICITDYVKLETVTENQGGTTEPEKPSEPEKPQDPVDPQPPVTVTKTYGIVTYAYLRIRAGAGVGYASVGQLKQGDRVEILETKQVGNVLWGRIDKGWICITDYVKLETVTEDQKPEPEKPKQETGTITATLLNVRAGAGTGYAVVTQLTQGAKVVILEKRTVDGTIWARLEQGWVSMKYVAV